MKRILTVLALGALLAGCVYGGPGPGYYASGYGNYGGTYGGYPGVASGEWAASPN
ncbi:MAG TPA: hypothetical protein VGL83_17265 [Stellaceae bacterium]|jgi:hypothetical protein